MWKNKEGTVLHKRSGNEMRLPFVSSDLRLVVVNLNGFQSSLAMVMCATVAHRVTTGMTVGTPGTVVRGSMETSGLALNGSVTMISAGMNDTTGVLTKGEYKRFAVYPSLALFVN